ncbi:MAG TPA: bifunctional glutamate N-acetyltransferase/amino-acid acetyltransferase ArgJ [Coriobacteriia bacterium]|nr:bifunctional glutamate N-acetyltransferase/amino-acid acetyltransferase ArgJ [Coriobacteriia bacterium]
MPIDANSGLSYAEGGVVAAEGFSCSGIHCGLKAAGKKDLALVVADEGAVPAAAVFTTSAVVAAPVTVSREHIAGGSCRAVVINAGNANACTGAQGLVDARATAEALAAELGCESSEIVVCSTGVIGVPLPVEVVIGGLAEAVSGLDNASGDPAAEAIMTTDTFAKQSAVSLDLDGDRITVGGMAKGSGMIAPNMATMLGVITTDAPLTSAACDAILRAAADTTFNRVTVDSDTSTNDTLVLMASGEAGGSQIDVGSPGYAQVAEAVRVVAEELSRMLARDGEGATKLITVTVTGAADEADAEKAARAIADSPLVKTAVFGRDANWGRVAMAIGKSGAALDLNGFDITFAGIEVCKDGGAVGFDEDAALEALSADEVCIDVDLGVGAASATILTCDLTYDYVRINGEYRS